MGPPAFEGLLPAEHLGAEHALPAGRCRREGALDLRCSPLPLPPSLASMMSSTAAGSISVRSRGGAGASTGARGGAPMRPSRTARSGSSLELEREASPPPGLQDPRRANAGSPRRSRRLASSRPCREGRVPPQPARRPPVRGGLYRRRAPPPLPTTSVVVADRERERERALAQDPASELHGFVRTGRWRR
jgi:hypothetical protein